jgi:putative transposase
VEVTAASVQDRDGALAVLDQLEPFSERLQRLFADSAYRGFLQDWASYMYEWALEIVTKPPDQKGFVVQAKRWIVERTIAWLVKFRRLVKDYEYLVETSKAMICWAMVSHMLNKLTRQNAAE